MAGWPANPLCRPQATGDLGRRMHLAMQCAFDGGARRVVLVGTDIPGLTAAILEQAFAALDEKDLVIGPSIDGGYWLVGMTRPENIFDGITWSRPDVLENTLTLARRKGMTPGLLDPLNDLDTPGDLAREMGPGQSPQPWLSVVIPALNEARQIARTITAASIPEAQIIVSDGGSTDRTVAIARSLGARIVSGQPNRAAQQNRGAAAARGEVLLFLHADTRLPPEYGDHIFETLMDRRTVLGAFRFATDIHTPAMQAIAFLTNLRAGRLKLPYGDQGLFMRRADFYRFGGFPETPIAEDLYLVRKMARNGRIAMAPVAAVTSGRRWRRLGPLRTTLVNTLVAVGCLAGIPPERLSPLYRLTEKKTRP
jgi:rSAM/selenodomain-associated transferase 2